MIVGAYAGGVKKKQQHELGLKVAALKGILTLWAGFIILGL
jgi:hypothetical protein